MDDIITENGSADPLFLLMLYTGARAMDGSDDRDVGRCGFSFFPRETWLKPLPSQGPVYRTGVYRASVDPP